MSRPSPAAARTVAVLNFFVEHPTQAFTLTDLVRSLRLSRATCHALLATLVDTGYLYRKPDKSYVIGPALVAAGRIARTYYSPIEIAREEMRSLADEFDAICTALFREKYELVLRDRAGGMSHLGWLPPIGQRVNMMTLWGGISFAWDSDAVILDWINKVDVDPASDEREQVLAAMKAARERGYFFAVRQDSWSNELADAPLEERRQHTNYFLRDVEDSRTYALSFMMAPVMDEKGVAFVITLSALRHDVTGAQIRQMAQALVEACRRVSDFLLRAGGQSDKG